LRNQFLNRSATPKEERMTPPDFISKWRVRLIGIDGRVADAQAAAYTYHEEELPPHDDTLSMVQACDEARMVIKGVADGERFALALVGPTNLVNLLRDLTRHWWTAETDRLHAVVHYGLRQQDEARCAHEAEATNAGPAPGKD
jgi:hypothetical protein